MDIILLIVDYLPDRDKIKVLSLCKALAPYRFRVTYRDGPYAYGRVKNLSFIKNIKYIYTFKGYMAVGNAIIIGNYIECDFSCISHMYIKHVDFGIAGTYWSELSGLLQKYNNIKNLVFDDKFNHPLTLPEGVKSVEFGNAFNKPITFPESIKFLKLGDNFSQPVTSYMPNLTEINIPNVPIKKEFIPNVTYMKFSNGFNASIEGCIPDGAKYLIFGTAFRQPIIGHLPPSVIAVWLSKNYPHEVPSGIEYKWI